jgi:hypothetical protein
VHHAVADGLAAVALMMTFLDLAPDTPDHQLHHGRQRQRLLTGRS